MRPVAILCGGKGTRLGYDGQKCLIPTAGRPFLHWKLDQLTGRGATAFYLLVNYRAGDVRDAIGDDWRGIPVTYLDDDPDPRLDLVPFVHWLTYGDSILDVELRPSMYPYVYVNAEHPKDAGVLFQWGRSTRGLARWTDAEALHVNTPKDWAHADENLRRYCLTR